MSRSFNYLLTNIWACWPGNSLKICRHIHLKGDKSGCVEEINNEGKIEIDRPNECPQDDQDPENPGFFYVENIGKIMQNDMYHICIY